MFRFINRRFALGWAGAGLAVAIIAGLSAGATETGETAAEVKSTAATDVAAEIDRLLSGQLEKSGTSLADSTSDEDFLRRATLDLAGTLPSPAEITLFSLNPDSNKRAKLVDQLLSEGDFAQNWSRYWRDVIFSRATDMRARLAQPAFEQWMTRQLQQNRKWDEIVTELITATGDVREVGQTALVFSHGGMASELASETSRIFMGIQIQCANCHDHPSDIWVRDDFHQLAAYFPRIRVRRIQEENRRSFEIVSFNVPDGGRRRQAFNPTFLMRRFDKDRDGKVTKDEVKDSPLARAFDNLLRRGDSNNDKALTLAELRKLPPPNNAQRQSSEYYMPDLADPSSRGKRIDPVFFVSKTGSKSGLRDQDRRAELAEVLTAKDNPWFAKALVNRIWGELLGEGFYMPIDDIGPEREASFPEVLNLLSNGFTANDYDLQWLFRTIVNTQAYQRQIRARDASDISLPFASAAPTRLRSDQLYSALTGVLGLTDTANRGPQRGGAGMYRRPQSGRGQFAALFGFDPSTPQADITGSVPQALFLMNSPLINNGVRGQGNTRLGRILEKFNDNDDALSELYLLVLSREPSTRETKIAKEYLDEVGNRREAFEDLMWSLLNSSEFLSKR
ncbi:MAG: DUF1549 domain-containing protein [Planctomycetaceae bacterium]|jgi:hypothetical protein|nr:DUF1549 domain-containing protein [Planctomycetaceae bacterium]MBT6493821.1 DUF1549 domain-containing protein [Planctomycetaceae bacterium]